MASVSLQNISAGSWNSLTKEEQKKKVLQVQETNNKMKLEIDDLQKTLAALRATIPEECREMLEKEKNMLLKHYTTAELLPIIPKEGPSSEVAQRMISNIRERVKAQVADRAETNHLNELIEMKREENEILRRKIREMAEEILNE